MSEDIEKTVRAEQAEADPSGDGTREGRIIPVGQNQTKAQFAQPQAQITDSLEPKANTDDTETTEEDIPMRGMQKPPAKTDQLRKREKTAE